MRQHHVEGFVGQRQILGIHHRSVDEIGKMTGRTESAIQTAASRFGLPKREGIKADAAEAARTGGTMRPCLASGENLWSKSKFNRLCVRCKRSDSDDAEAA